MDSQWQAHVLVRKPTSDESGVYSITSQAQMIGTRAGLEVSLRCPRCGSEFDLSRDHAGCPKCASTVPVNLVAVYSNDLPRGRSLKGRWDGRAPGMWRYSECLPVSGSAVVSLGEGGTPLVDCPNLGAAIGLPRLLLKNESSNPTWSYKDRLASVGVSWAKAAGRGGIVLSSSGNAGASAAAYAARAALPTLILTTKAFPAPMRGLMTSYGAMVVATESPRDRWTLNRAVASEWGWLPLSNMADPPVGSHPVAVEAYKTLAFEIAQSLSWQVPDAVIAPVAYGDGLAGMWRGFRELHELGITDREPRMIAAEAYGSLEQALARELESPVATGASGSLAYSAGAPQSTYQALAALRESKGAAVTVGNDQIVAAQRHAGTAEGLFVELSSAMTIAAARKLAADGALRPDDRVVLLITSGGLKDLGTGRPETEIPVVSPTLGDLNAALDRHFGFHV
jgi:threonine synthase